MSGSFDGKCVIVTGAASGIGRATAEQFARNGAFVVVGDVDEAGGQSLVEELGSDSAIFVRTDVSDEEQVKTLISTAHEARGRIDVLFNNAGVFDPNVSVLDITPENFARVVQVLLLGPMLGTKHVTPIMQEQGGGVIINTTSVTALQAAGQSHIYSSAKAGLIHYTTTSAAELGKHGIRVNAVCPGGVLTAMVRDAMGISAENAEQVSAFEQIAVQAQLIPVPGQSDHVAKAVLYLASDDAEWMTGHNLVIDGGNTIAKWSPVAMSQ